MLMNMPISSEIFGMLIIIAGHFYSCQFKWRRQLLCTVTAFFTT